LLTGGNPKGVLDIVEGHDMKRLVLVAAKRQAEKSRGAGSRRCHDCGARRRGHLGRGDAGTFILTPQIVNQMKIPVIASGGIIDDRGLMADSWCRRNRNGNTFHRN
jgi:NAD(P)H-dependent flavin oxidoreductase YrpB (nitropropane dioxygenase family)